MANRKATEPHDRDTVQGSSEDLEHNNFCSTTLAELSFNWLDQIPTETSPSPTHQYSTRLKTQRKAVITRKPSTPSTIPDSNMGRTRPTTQQGDNQTSTAKTESIIRTPAFVQKNLRRNNIYINKELLIPEYVQTAWNWIQNRQQEYPQHGRAVTAIFESLANLQTEYHIEERVSRVLKRMDIIKELTFSDRPLLDAALAPLYPSLVPGSDRLADFRVCSTKPDMLYGYELDMFTESQEIAMDKGEAKLSEGVNKEMVTSPFFVIEAEGLQPLQWAVNQCLVGAATMANVLRILNSQIEKHSSGPLLDTTFFSIAINQYTAILFATWHNEKGEYHTRYIKQFGLSATEPEDVHKLRAYINAILDWGRTERLPKIQRALDSLLFKSCAERSAEAKARPSPSVEDDDLKDCGRECKHRRYG